MWEKSIQLTEVLKRDGLAGRDSAVIELSPWASKATLDIIGIAGLGRKFDTLIKAQDPLQQLYEELTDPSLEKVTFGMLNIIFGREVVRYMPLKTNQDFDRITNGLNQTCMPMIQSKKRAILEKEDDHIDILSLLIKSNNFSDSELKDQLLTFLAAG